MGWRFSGDGVPCREDDFGRYWGDGQMRLGWRWQLLKNSMA